MANLFFLLLSSPTLFVLGQEDLMEPVLLLRNALLKVHKLIMYSRKKIMLHIQGVPENLKVHKLSSKFHIFGLPVCTQTYSNGPGTDQR